MLWRRVVFTLVLSALCGVFLALTLWRSDPLAAITRTAMVGLVALTVFSWLERWPRRLPRGLARWALQVVAVGLVIPPAAAIVFWILNPPGTPAFYFVPQNMRHYSALTTLGLFVAPWAALAALVRQKDSLARTQALAFDLERTELERQALDARLRLLQAQVAPHFLFNTLANVQALVDAGSPQASRVLANLIAYLRAAVPRLNDPATTMRQEVELVRAYLELMHMRMPDRLQFAVHADDAALALRCPPMTLLTLVENAVRHGIDPSEDGGRIEIHVRKQGARCLVRVSDSGTGPSPNGGSGTGLATLRERLRLAFQGDADLSVSAQEPRGFRAEVNMPALGPAS
ncbi:MAG TPA: histidine kinase [Candidatus Eisenbacteria bacterium]|jgi:LytS/YehU family sensor histidine kinase|nr:histidine kinase [Candidatus Eisenbacteria bacterium]